jgi:hypothetical protein
MTLTYSNAIKSGFRIINRNWQLILIQLGMMIMSCIGFFLFVGIPLAIAFVIFGLDLTEITKLKDLISTVDDPTEIISRYLGLILVILISFLIYIIIMAAVGIYVFGGSAGLIGTVVRDNTLRFGINRFFSEGKRLFFPLIGFTAIIGLIFIGVAFILGLFGGGVGAIISTAKEHEATLALFLGIFFSLLLFCIGLILIIPTIALALYGVAAIVFKSIGPIKAAKETISYLYRQPKALLLYCITFGGYIIVSFLLILIGAPFNLIPIVGTIIAIPYQLFSYAVQSYLGLVIIAITFTYYFSTEIMPQETTKAGAEPIDKDSTQKTDTSQTQVPSQEQPLSPKEHPE